LAAPSTAPVLARMPEIASVVVAPFAHGELKLTERWLLARALRGNQYTHAFVLPNSFKSALIPWFAGIPRRVGFVGEARYGVLNQRYMLDEQALPLMAERYAQLAEAPAAPPHRPLAPTRLRVDEANRREALQRLGLDDARPIVAFCPGAEFGPAKRWPARHFAALGKTLIDRGAQVWLFGSAKDHEAAREITAALPEACANLTGKTDLASAIDLMSLARVVVSNDSGLMHVAAALERPIVALYGSSSPRHTPPLSDRAALLSLELECSPCYKRTCPLGHLRCLNDLGPDQVVRAIDRLGALAATSA
jgi:heptosyltransferase-2